ncbi:MAG: hypothetical protein ACTSPD_10310 [Promethearchaeota archaeon]
MKFLLQKGAKQKFNITFKKDKVKVYKRMIDCVHLTIRIYIWTIHFYIWELIINKRNKW